MRVTAALACCLALASAQAPASTRVIQPGQFRVFGQARQAPVQVPGTRGQVVSQFIDQNGAAIPIQQVGQQQRPQVFSAPQQQPQRFAPQTQQAQLSVQQLQQLQAQQAFAAQQQAQRAQPQPQRFAPQPQQQAQRFVPQQQPQRFAPQPVQQPQRVAPQASPFEASSEQRQAHQTFSAIQQQQIAIQQQQFTPQQLAAHRDFVNNPPPPPRPQPQSAPVQQQQQQFRAAPVRQPQQQQFRPAPPQPQRRPAPAPQQQFSQFPSQQGAPARRPQAAPRPAVPAPRQQALAPLGVNDELGQQVVAAEQYAHDTTGDATVSRFQLFQQGKLTKQAQA